MGVPGYFARVLRASPRAVSHDPPAVCSRLLIDFNCVVHRQVLPGTGQTAQDVIDRTTAYLSDKVIAACRPARGARILVAADGIPPLSKMMQQRERRFVARYKSPPIPTRNDDSGGAGLDDPFERSDITPGTAFAARLDEAVRAHCQRLSMSGAFGEIVYSGTDEPGEGEHKIMVALRKDASDASGRDTTWDGKPVVYGLDADLLLLCMLHGSRAGSSWPLVAREQDAIDSAGSRDDRLRFVDLESVCPKVAGGADARSVRNHVVCSFLCGNDFLPPLSCLSVHDGWIEALRDMSADLDLAAEEEVTGAEVVAGGRGLRVVAADLETLLKRLALREDADFFRADQKYWSARPRVDDAAEAWNSYPLLHKDETLRSIMPGSPGWRRRFYRRVMRIRHDEDVSRACDMFAAGVAWCTSYYSGGHGALGTEPSWFYPYHYGPSSADLFNHVSIASSSVVYDVASEASGPFVKGPCAESGFPAIPFTPDMVRDFVIPPRRGKGPTASDPWAYLFPVDFRMETYLRHKVWHCAAALPFPLDVSRDVCRKTFTSRLVRVSPCKR